MYLRCRCLYHSPDSSGFTVRINSLYKTSSSNFKQRVKMVRAFYWPATTSATVVDDAPLGVLGEDEHQGLVHGGLPQQVREGGTHLVHDVAAPRADDLGLEHPVHRVLQGGLRGARNNPGGRGIAGFGEGGMSRIRAAGSRKGDSQ